MMLLEKKLCLFEVIYKQLTICVGVVFIEIQFSVGSGHLSQ